MCLHPFARLRQLSRWIALVLIFGFSPQASGQSLEHPSPSPGKFRVSAHPVLSWSYGSTNLLANGGFEDGTDDWVIGEATLTNRVDTIEVAEGSRALTGSGGQVQRDITLPPGGGSLRLSYKLIQRADESAVKVEFLDASNSSVVLAGAVHGGADWRTYGVNLSPFAGHTVRLTWDFSNDGTNLWGLDDVRIAPVAPDTAFEVWVGTNSPASLTHLGQTTEAFWPLRFLPPGRQLYWRVDVVQGGQTTPGPVWSFQTAFAQRLTQVWVDPLPPIVCDSQPLTVGFQVADTLGFYQGPRFFAVEVSALGEGTPPPLVVVSELSLAPEVVELQNVAPTAVDLSGWRLNLMRGIEIVVPPGSVLQPGARFEVHLGSSLPSRWPVLQSPLQAGWSPQGRAGVILSDSSSNIVDCLFYERSVRGDPTASQTGAVHAAEWPDLPVTGNVDAGKTIQRVGGSDRNSAADWVLALASIGQSNFGLSAPFVAGRGAVPIVDPVWRALPVLPGYAAREIRFAGTASNVVLHVVAKPGIESAIRGTSDLFNLSPDVCLKIETPEYLEENQGTVPGALRLRILHPLDRDLRVQLEVTSTLDEGVEGPSELIIPAGSTEVSADLRVEDNGELTGPRSVTLSAMAEGFTQARVNLMIQDNEIATLQIKAPTTAIEGNMIEAELGVDPPPHRPVQIQLSSDPPEIFGPESELRFTVMPGTSRLPIGFWVAENQRYDGNIPVVLRASFANWIPGEARIELFDNETKDLSLVFLDGPEAFEGLSAGVCRVSLGSTVATNVPIALRFDPEILITSVDPIVIPSGESSVDLPVQALDDALVTGSRVVTVRATSPGWKEAEVLLPVRDNDPARFRLRMPPGPAIAGQSFTVRGIAETLDGYPLEALWDFALTAELVGSDGQSVPSESTSPTQYAPGGFQFSLKPLQDGAPFRVRIVSGPLVGESTPIAVWDETPGDNLLEALYDAPRDRLIIAGAGAFAQNLFALDLRTGSRTEVAFFGDQPLFDIRRLALADDGETLHVLWDGGRRRARVDLPTLKTEGIWWLGFGPTVPPVGYERRASDLAAVPGAPDATLVSFNEFPFEDRPRPSILEIFEGEREWQLPASFEEPTAVELLPGLYPDQFFTLGDYAVGEFQRLSDGIRAVTKSWGFRRTDSPPPESPVFPRSVSSGGMVLSQRAELLDPALPGRIRLYGGNHLTGAVAVDPVTRRIAWYRLGEEGTFRIFAPFSLTEVWREDNPTESGALQGLVSAGPHRWAAIVNGELRLLTDAAPEPEAATDLALSASIAHRDEATSQVTVLWTVKNQGSEPASGIRLTMALPQSDAPLFDALTIQSVSSNAVPAQHGLHGPNYALEDLAPGAEVEIAMKLRASLDGVVEVSGFVGSHAADPNPLNNRAAVRVDGLPKGVRIVNSGVGPDGRLRIEFVTIPGWVHRLAWAPLPDGPWEGEMILFGDGQLVSTLVSPGGDGVRFWSVHLNRP